MKMTITAPSVSLISIFQISTQSWKDLNQTKTQLTRWQKEKQNG